jgi:UDP-N-acetyl-D-glucosamine dehydrogenase
MKSLKFSARFIELAVDVNQSMPAFVAAQVADLLNEDRLAVNGAQVLILGVAYKPDVGDVRESPALDVIGHLHRRGARIRYHDPFVSEIVVEGATLKNVDLTDEVLASSDIVVLLTDHSVFDYERIVAKASRVYDTRNATRDVAEGRERIRKL